MSDVWGAACFSMLQRFDSRCTMSARAGTTEEADNAKHVRGGTCDEAIETQNLNPAVKPAYLETRLPRFIA